LAFRDNEQINVLLILNTETCVFSRGDRRYREFRRISAPVRPVIYSRWQE